MDIVFVLISSYQTVSPSTGLKLPVGALQWNGMTAEVGMPTAQNWAHVVGAASRWVLLSGS